MKENETKIDIGPFLNKLLDQAFPKNKEVKKEPTHKQKMNAVINEAINSVWKRFKK